jgi:hypothetical protein
MARGFTRKSRQQPVDSVSVNARLAQMPLDELINYAELNIMDAGYQLSKWRTERVIDPSYIDRSVRHAEWAVDALRAIQQRDRPGVAR